MGVAIPHDPSIVDQRHQQHAGPLCDHLVQFYDQEEYLHSVLSDFFVPVLQDGESAMGAVVLGRSSTIRHLEDCLAWSKYTCDGLIDRDGERWREGEVESGTTLGKFYTRGERRVLLAYADEVLSLFVPENQLRAREFRKTVHELLAQLQSEKFQPQDQDQLPIYAYGELVDVLCGRGQHLIALELEAVWNGILASHNMTLLCGYKMDSFQGSLVENIFTQVCHSHATVAPTESYSSLATDSQKLEMIASLQQKVVALNAAQVSHWSKGDAEERIKHREQFVDVLCHELRNPVSGIMGNVELLQMGLDVRQGIISRDRIRLGDRRISEADIALLQKQLSDDYDSVDAIATCAEHMKSISDDVLNLSKLEEGKVILVNVLFNLKATITSIIKMFLSSARKKGIRLLAKVPSEELRVIGDCGRVAQVLINLISNAIKFTEAGSITIELNCLGPALVGRGMSVFKIAVRDTGCGLSQDEISELFQRFVQPVSPAMPEHGGSGLGLYISKTLAELMGGLLYVESSKGEGSTFVFTFQAEPCIVNELMETSQFTEEHGIPDYTHSELGRQSSTASKSSTQESDHAEWSFPTSPSPSSPSSPLCLPTTNTHTDSTPPPNIIKAHILVVDDNLIILRMLTRILETSNSTTHYPQSTTSNITVSTASNGYEALSQLISASSTLTPIDLVLMDLEMPFLDGLSTMREIRRLTNPDGNGRALSAEQKNTAERLRKVKVVGLTGDARESRFKEAREVGMVECLKKPMGRGVLLALVGRVLRGKECEEGKEATPALKQDGVNVVR